MQDVDKQAIENYCSECDSQLELRQFYMTLAVHTLILHVPDINDRVRYYKAWNRYNETMGSFKAPMEFLQEYLRFHGIKSQSDFTPIEHIKIDANDSNDSNANDSNDLVSLENLLIASLDSTWMPGRNRSFKFGMTLWLNPHEAISLSKLLKVVLPTIEQACFVQLIFKGGNRMQLQFLPYNYTENHVAEYEINEQCWNVCHYLFSDEYVSRRRSITTDYLLSYEKHWNEDQSRFIIFTTNIVWLFDKELNQNNIMFCNVKEVAKVFWIDNEHFGAIDDDHNLRIWKYDSYNIVIERPCVEGYDPIELKELIR
jgi:hypothetical protein